MLNKRKKILRTLIEKDVPETKEVSIRKLNSFSVKLKYYETIKRSSSSFTKDLLIYYDSLLDERISKLEKLQKKVKNKTYLIEISLLKSYYKSEMLNNSKTKKRLKEFGEEMKLEILDNFDHYFNL